MPAGNEQILRAIAEGIRKEPIIMDDVLKIVLDQTSKYVQNNFNVILHFDTIDDLENQLVGIVDEYPVENALIYGIGKAESTTIGSTGVISRRLAKGGPKALVDKLGLTEYLKGSKSLYDVLSKYKALLVQIGFVKDEEMILTNHDSGDVDVQLCGKCSFMDACQALSNEGVYDIFGNIACVRTLIFTGIAETILKRSFDIKVENYNPPNCKTKVFEI